jgi:hypothetical protein
VIWPWVPTDRRILALNRKLKGAAAIITQLRHDKAQLTDANATLRRLVDIATQTRDAAVAERNELRERLAAAIGRLALIDREEDMRDEDKAKRLSDGMGDQ